MKICVVGNSQIAAFKGGWDIVHNEFPAIEVTFFGAHQRHWHALKRVGDVLVASSSELREPLMHTSGGLDHIATSYDRHVVIGNSFGARAFLSFVEANRTKVQDDDFIWLAAEAMRKTPAFRIMDMLTDLSPVPLAGVPTPFHSEDGPEDSYGITLNWGSTQKLAALYRELLAYLADHHWFHLFQQPQETISRPFFTKAVYSINAERMQGKGQNQVPEDFTHMNAEFGALCWREILTDHFFLGSSVPETA